jgi:peptidoglycan/LPS O-acetylase OafA/YrhL
MSAPRIVETGPAPPRPAVPRWPGLDWLRASAAVLVVLLHAGMAYLVARMPGLAWSTHDPLGHPVVDALSWWINGFVMPLFFVQSGFLAHRVMCSRGPREFLIHRSQRLLVPLALGSLLILPLDLYAWLLGWAAEGKIPLRKLRSLKIDSPLGDHLWGVSHLWFLEYLWVFCVAAWFVVCVGHWRNGTAAEQAVSPRVTDRRRTGRFAIARIVLTGLCSGALWWDPQILIGFRHSWWPLPANLMFYGPWFALGWLVHARSQENWRAGDVSPPMRGGQFSLNGMTSPRNTQLSTLNSQPTRRFDASGDSRPPLAGRWDADTTPFGLLCEWRIAAAIGLFAVLLPLIHRHVAEESTGGERIVLVGLFVLHAWLMVTGLFGVSLRWLNRRPPVAVRYLAEASFWIYLFHHPVVGLTQVTLSPLTMPLIAKFGLVTLSGLVLPLLTYQAFIRRTRVGALLTGQPLAGEQRAPDPDVLRLPEPPADRLRKSA